MILKSLLGFAHIDPKMPIMLLFISFSSLLIILANDIEVNPGPVRDNNYYTKSLRNLFTVVYANMRSLLSCPIKLDELKIMAQHSNPAIISIGETWLNDNDDSLELLIDNYSLVRKDRGSRGGGVLVYIRNDLNFQRLVNLENDGTESIWISVMHPDRKKSLFGFYYRSPSMNNTDLQKWMTSLDESLNLANCLNPWTINLLGDFNAKNKLWFNEGINDNAGIILQTITDKYRLSQLVSSPTRITDTSRSLLDLFFSDSPSLVIDTYTLPTFYSCDHNPIVADFLFKFPKENKPRRKIYHYDAVNVELLKNELSQLNFDKWFTDGIYPDVILQAWSTKFISVMDKCIPFKVITLKRTQPWFTKELYLLKKKMLRFYKRWMNKGSIASENHYKKCVENTIIKKLQLNLNIHTL